MAIKRKKLYFNVSITTSQATGFQAVVPCTAFRSSYAGDLYGGVLEDYPAATIGTSAETRRAREVTAWFQPVNTGGTGTTQGLVALRFVQATTTLSAATSLAVPSGGGADGGTPVYTRHFGIGLRRMGLATMTGRLYVQRQHSIEV